MKAARASGGSKLLPISSPGLLSILGLPDLLVIVVVFAILFGGKKIPELAKGLGLGIRNFKGAMKSDDKSDPKNQV